MLAEDFDTILHNLGMAWLEHPLFHHAPVAIRFEIGGDEPVYLECTYSDENTEKPTPNPAYVQGALERAIMIYRNLPAPPGILRIDGYPEEKPVESLLTAIQQRAALPAPHEQVTAHDGRGRGYICTSTVLLGSQQNQLSTGAASPGDHSGGHRRLERLCVQRLSDRAGAIPLPSVR